METETEEAEEVVAADHLADQEKCTTQPVLIVGRKHRFLSSQQTEGLFTAETVIRSTNDIE